MQNKERIFNDELDVSTLLSVFLDNLNLIVSVFSAVILVITIYYFSAEKLYRSSSLLEIKNNNSSSFLPDSLDSGINPFSSDNSLQAEKEIYQSDATIEDALKNLNKLPLFEDKSIIPSINQVKSNLVISTSSKSLMSIDFVSNDEYLSTIFLNLLNEEFIKDRKNFIKQSSAAGKIFIQKEIPRIKLLLSEAEENLNAFKVSTNTSDVKFF